MTERHRAAGPVVVRCSRRHAATRPGHGWDEHDTPDTEHLSGRASPTSPGPLLHPRSGGSLTQLTELSQ